MLQERDEQRPRESQSHPQTRQNKLVVFRVQAQKVGARKIRARKIRAMKIRAMKIRADRATSKTTRLGQR
jgi:hypothetical protein